ncbi:MAG: bifunctional pyr operon transcriptional regulator/uracil phosphoribosyltransferase PyrR [Candidatus Nanopelagicales bacterium]
MTSPARVFDADDMSRVLSRIAHEIIERSRGVDDLVILGIQSRGVPLAQRIASRIEDIAGHSIPLGALDVTMYRDDVSIRGARPVGVTQVPDVGIDDQLVVLVDDVLFSGRTVRAALDALNDIGRPRSVQLAVLIDRGHRELPIRADYVGKNLPTASAESVMVRVSEIDGHDEVLLGRDDRAASVASDGYQA